MKKSIILISLLVLISGTASAQSSDSRESRLHVSFFPPLSTNGRHAAEYTNNVSLNILAGVSRNERGTAWAGLANIVKNNAEGALFAGLYNGVGSGIKGTAFAGLVNHSAYFTGAEFAGLINNASGTNRGVQWAGLFNLSGDLDGAQFAGLSNLSENIRGAQFAGLFNIAGNITGGSQWAGLANIAGNLTGGLQAAGFSNVAGNIHGLQLAGLFNVGGQVRGVQIAGLVNIAQSSDCSIALINILGDGEMGIGIAYNEIGNITATFRSGGRVVYGILGAGYNFQFNDGVAILEGGFGARIHLSERFRINAELKSAYLGEFKSDETYHQSLSLLPAFRITPRVEVFAGPSLNFMYSDNPELLDDFPSGTLWEKYGEKNIKQLHAGFSAGMYFRF